MSSAHLAIVLHAHLPFVHHPEHDRHLEEEWLFEAVTETYVPLLLSWDRLRRDGVPFRLTMSVTPTLLEMLATPLLQARCAEYIARRIELAEREAHRTRKSPAAHAVALHYVERFRTVMDFFSRRHEGDLITPLREAQEAGHVEIMTCAATHALLPLLQTPNALRAQIETGVETTTRHFKRRPYGFWLPECGFSPGIDEALAAAGLKYFIVDAHGLLNALPTPPHGVHAPVLCPSGVAAFARDLESSKQVWSSTEGYPGDGAYREFYRDLGYDADYDYIKPFLHDDGVRRNLGIKYHRVTGGVALDGKELYDPAAALRRAGEHAGHFLYSRQHQARFLKSKLPAPPVIVAPYDAELFGHWWYEGPEFLEQLFRAAQFAREDFCVSTLSDCLAHHPPTHAALPAASTWGNKGGLEVWVNGANDWVYRHLHWAEERMSDLARKHREKLRPPLRAALDHAARELMLAQGSDWAFLMTAGTATPYAEKRTRDHLHRFAELYYMIEAGRIDTTRVKKFRELSPIFAEMDYRMFG
jgi:1,4-alpha-glucan branching enzyme